LTAEYSTLLGYKWLNYAVAETLLGLRTELKAAIEKLTGSDRDGQVTAVKSGCELFLRFITLCKLEDRVSFSNHYFDVLGNFT